MTTHEEGAGPSGPPLPHDPKETTMAERVYPLGLPVDVVVRDDGTVTAYVDLSEASRRRDMRESQEGLDDPVPDDVIVADADLIEAAWTNGRLELKDWRQT